MVRFTALAIFTVGMMFALHPLPREPWGVLGLGDLFTGYVMAFIGGTVYSAIALRRPRRSEVIRLDDRRRMRRAA